MTAAASNLDVGAEAGDNLHLTKYEGAGNDFLVVADRAGSQPLDPDEVRVLCHRRRGIGADGVLRLSPGSEPGSELAMELRNADGTAAEMSGNGIRCLVHAAVDAGWVRPGSVEVATGAGRRRVLLTLGTEPGSATAEVEMGQPHITAGAGSPARPPATSEPADATLANLLLQLRDLTNAGAYAKPQAVDGWLPAPGSASWFRASRVDMGNPHVVVVVPSLDPVVAATWGAAVDAATAGGTNVELVQVLDRHTVEIGVWERGAGSTAACGTGSCAVAAACWDWDLVDAPLTVMNPGGPLVIDRGAGSVVLRGPSRRVASVTVDRRVLAARMADSGMWVTS